MKTKNLLKKAFLLLALMGGATSVWGEAITVTWLPNNMSSITTAGTASVNDILTVSALTYSSDVNAPALVTYDSKKWGNFVPTTGTDKNNYSKDDYITFAVTVKSGYTFTPTGATAYAVGAGTGNNGAQIFATVQTSNGANAIVNSKNADTPTALSLGSFSSTTYTEGQTVYFYIHIGRRNDAEKGVAIRDVVLTGTYDVAGMTKLSTPEITVTQATGQVTIGSVANASKVTYTIDGTDPTASSTTYSAPFIVDANCTIKAIAIGDGVSYSNSIIASQAANITVANPVLTAHNGTVGITCATDGATIKYSTDNETWTDYSHPLTYFSNTTVHAKAEHASYKNNSGTVNLAISAAPAATAGSQTKILQWVTPGENNWEYMSGDNGNGGTTNYGIQGKADTEDEGWSLWISPNGSGYYDKALSWATNTTTIDDVVYSFMKNSNGRQFNIGMPSNLRANRITIYSYNAAADQSTIWSTVGGSTYTTDTEVSIISSDNESPEIRVFSLDDVANNIILNNAGNQQCFMAVVDYTVYVPGPADAETTAYEKVADITWDGGSVTSKVWKLTSNNDYTFQDAEQKGSNGYFKIAQNKTYTIGVPENITISKIEITGSSTSGDGTPVTVGSNSFTFPNSATTHAFIIESPTAGADVQFSTSSKEMGITNIALYISSTITLTTSANMAGWRAFYDASNGYTLDENTTAYVATDVNDGVVKMKPISEVPAGTPVILKTTSSADNYKMTLTKEPLEPYEDDDNLLTWETSAVSNKYRLGYGAEGVGFYPYSGTPSSGAVILNVSSNQARSLRMVFGSDITGINQVDNGQVTIDSSLPVKRVVNGKLVIEKNGQLFNANGQQVK